MILKIEIDSENAAFADDPHVECARILRDLVRKLENESWNNGGPLYDINGNKVGHWEFTIGSRPSPRRSKPRSGRPA